MKFQIFTLIIISITLSGCVVGTALSLPFKAVGAVTNVVTPDAVGDTISGVGDVVDAAIPF